MSEANNDKAISLANLAAFKGMCDAAYLAKAGEGAAEVERLMRFVNENGVYVNTEDPDYSGTDTKYKSYSIEGDYAGDSPFKLYFPYLFPSATIAVDKGNYPDMTAGKVGHKLTIIAGGATVEYDGSAAKTVDLSAASPASASAARALSAPAAVSGSAAAGHCVQADGGFLAGGTAYAVLADGSVQSLPQGRLCGVTGLYITRKGGAPYVMTGGVKVLSVPAGGDVYDIVVAAEDMILSAQ